MFLVKELLAMELLAMSTLPQQLRTSRQQKIFWLKSQLGFSDSHHLPAVMRIVLQQLLSSWLEEVYI